MSFGWEMLGHACAQATATGIPFLAGPALSSEQAGGRGPSLNRHAAPAPRRGRGERLRPVALDASSLIEGYPR